MTNLRMLLPLALLAAGSLAVGSGRAEEAEVSVHVDARKVLAANDRFWANVVFHPTEYLSTEWGKEHIALLRESGAALKYVRIYNQPEDAVYVRDDGTNGYRMLARLGPEFVPSHVAPAEAPVRAVAARDGKRQAAVLLAHFRNQHPDNLGPGAVVELEIETQFPAGTPVVLHHWRVDETHSNAYTMFRRLGRPDKPTAEQIAQIKARMGLEPLEAPRKLRIDGAVKLTVELPCNALSLVELVAETDR